MWYSLDDDLQKWRMYIPKRNASRGDEPTCTICPSSVPPSVKASYLGDNCAWSEPDTSTEGRTYYVLEGAGRCPDKGALSRPWCGWQDDPNTTTPQALLFKSKDSISWEYVGVFLRGESFTKATRFDCPDTFALSDGRQAFMWLADGKMGASSWCAGNGDPNDSW